jgi:acyl-homoserine lactone acylase PvdQ
MIVAFNKLEGSLKEWFGTLDSSQWKWGTIHTKTFTYVPWTELPLIGRLFNRGIPADGNSRTLNVGVHSYQKKTFETFATATFRFITDFNRTVYSIDLGVSDRVTSPYYDNFL